MSAEENIFNNINRGGVRSSNLELYRIIVMLLIVAHHYVVNSGLTAADGPIFSDIWSWKSLFLLLFGAWGKTGINCFVLITCYFMIEKETSMRKWLKLLCEVMFYNAVVGGIFWLTGYHGYDGYAFFRDQMIFTDLRSDFTSCFLIFYLTIPWVKKFAEQLSMKQLIVSVIGFRVLYGLLRRVPYLRNIMGYIFWFMILLLVMYLVRKYFPFLIDKRLLWLKMMLMSWSLAIVTVLGKSYILSTGKDVNIYQYVSDSHAFLATILALSSFMVFRGLDIPQSRIINTVAASCFGVLCIHANSDTMRQWLWKDTLNNVGAYSSDCLVLHAFGSVIGIFIICVIIDWLRINLIEKRIFG